MKVSLGMKLFVGFGAIIALLVGIVVYNLIQLQNLKSLEDEGASKSLAAINLTEALDIGQSLYNIIGSAVINRSTISKEEITAMLDDELKKDNSEIETVIKYRETDEEKAITKEIQNYYDKITNLIQKEMLPAIFASETITDNIVKMDEELDGYISGFVKPLVTFIEMHHKETEAANTQFDSTFSSMFIVSLVIACLGLLVGIAIAFGLTRSISGSLLKISDTLTSSSGQIASASSQLSSSSQEIANGATEQASSIEETTSSMEELASMVKQNATNSQEAANLADKASESSQIGYGQMEKMLGSITEINKSSNEIRKVINVIDNIAFQTNILALNAAVEAARAGEVGMGFAVVADEVKNLANESATAAKETSSMIEESIKRTEIGMDQATKLAETFKDILSHAKKVSEMAREVETASKQQDTGINQVNKAIVQFDEIVQNNASSAEETASSAEEMTAQAYNLKQIVSTLMKLVSGADNGHNGHQTQMHMTQMTTGITVAPGNGGKKPAITHVQTHAPLTAAGKTTKRKEILPEKLIPFEEDEDLRNS